MRQLRELRQMLKRANCAEMHRNAPMQFIAYQKTLQA
jgi:hypothetical protein